MRKLFLLLFYTLFGICQYALAASGTILYVPMDDRPVCLDYTVETMRAAGWDVKVPPREYIAGIVKKGEPEKLMEWLETEGKTSTAIVASSDALMYGGLVGSRTHNISTEVLNARAERLLHLKNTTHNQNVYIFTTIMRSPKASAAPVEPAYYEQYGPKLFRLGLLEDKKEIKGLHRREHKELVQLHKDIPEDVITDLYNRRNGNLKITKMLLNGAKDGKFDYMLLGRDDTAPFSQAHREARNIMEVLLQFLQKHHDEEELYSDNNHESRIMDILLGTLPKGKIRFFAGADQLGLVLLLRAANRLQYELPMVYITYAAGTGLETVPTYEDNTVGESARQHVLAAGALPIRKRTNVDLVLAINTPKDGHCLEASNAKNAVLNNKDSKRFADKVSRLVMNGHNVAVADVKYGNGADNTLVNQLFARKMAYKVASYGGWNTSGNTIGFSLAQGMLARKMDDEDKNYLLTQRYLDDWAYQANSRMKVYQKLIWPNYWPGSGLKDEKLAAAEKNIAEEIALVAKPLIGDAVDQYKFTLPWQRMFEVQVSK